MKHFLAELITTQKSIRYEDKANNINSCKFRQKMPTRTVWNMLLFLITISIFQVYTLHEFMVQDLQFVNIVFLV